MYALKSEGSTGPRKELAAAHSLLSSSCWVTSASPTTVSLDRPALGRYMNVPGKCDMEAGR